MANVRHVAERQARRYFRSRRDRRIFLNQMNAEAGFQTGRRSPAGAQGPAQIMPATARSWGVDPNNPDQAFGAAAKHMAGYLKAYRGSWAKALSAYNAGPGAVQKYGGVPPYAETRNYIRKILGGASDAKAGRTGDRGSGASVSFDPQSVKLEQKEEFDSAGFETARKRSVAGNLIAKNRGTGSILFKTGLLTTDTPSRDDFTKTRLMSKVVGKGATVTPGRPARGGGGGEGRRGQVVGAPKDRAGVRTNSAIIDFTKRVAGIYGRPISLGTGTAHSRMTASGNVSDHWGGNALDLPAAGSQLTRMGQAALVAAGWSRRRARRARGGIYNVNGYQIIFNAPDHHDHLHVGRRG